MNDFLYRNDSVKYLETSVEASLHSQLDLYDRFIKPENMADSLDFIFHTELVLSTKKFYQTN